MSSNLHAFVDESTRRLDYLICVATVSVQDLNSSRTTMQNLRARGQRRLHFAGESDLRRRKILSAIAELETETTIYVASHRNQTRARGAILEAMVPQLRKRGVSRLLLDARQGQDQRDRATIYRTIGSDPDPEFSYTHQPSASEPLLWIPDAVAWAWGRGGYWRTRVEDLGLITEAVTVEVMP
jgi:hypothetical protein